LAKCELIQSLKIAISEEENLRSIWDSCRNGKPPYPLYSVHDDLLSWNERSVLPENHAITQQISHECHSSPLGGHAGVAHTVACIATQFRWKGTQKNIAKYVKNFLI